ncbi:MAG: ATP-binding protein [Planctomycetes bacterium]|nr:ATP-binding protein [Planctomycetota bacterium]
MIEGWGTDQGLPSNTVSGIAQTPDGYLWCGTHDGAVRFDGFRFVRIGPDDPANQEANRILCVYADSRGQLWLGTDGAGLLRYAGGAFTAFAVGAGSPLDVVRCLAEDAAGDVWLGTRGGLGRLKDGKVTWFTGAGGFENAAGSVWGFAFDRDGGLWIASWNKPLKVFDGKRFESVLLTPEVKVPMRAVHADRTGTLWAGMSEHAFRRGDDGRWTRIDDAGHFTGAEVVAFCQRLSGELWVGTRKGLYRQHEGRWTAFTMREGLASAEVRALLDDREGNVWVATGTAGLVRLKRRIVKTFTAQQGLTDGRVLALREGPDGHLWVGMHDGRLVHGTAEASWSEAVEGLPPDAPVESVLFTRDGALWVGTFGNGLFRLHGGKTTRFVPSVGTPARIDKVLALAEDRAGDVWVGTFYSLYKCGLSEAPGTNVLTQVLVDGRELRAPIVALLESQAGGMWVACEGLGVARLLQGKATWLTRGEGLPTHFVRSLHEDAAGALWIGTASGLCCSRQGRITTFTEAHGLVGGGVSQILEDDAGDLWLGSNRGILRVAKSELHAVADGRRASLEVFTCGRGEGMLSAECSGGYCPAGLRTRDGKLWFPTAKGLVMVDPSHLRRRADPAPPVYIEEVRADGRLVARPHPAPGVAPEPSSPQEPLLLPRGTRHLEVVYTALSLAAPERVRFRHRLEGLDPDWTEAGTARSAVYGKLPPGRYRFQVMACSNGGTWSEPEHALAFRVAAPFWQTWWFLSSGGLACAGIVIAVVRVASVRHLRRRLRRLEEAHAIEKERMRIAQDMHDDMGGKLSRISFLSDLARRNLSDATQTGRQIDEVSEAARDLIRTVDEIVWAVSPRNDTLDSLAHYICRHAEEFFELTPVDLELELPPEIPAHRLSSDVRHNLYCAVKEALNNVLKHAGATKVRIAFAVNASSFRVAVTDDGLGFRPEDVWAAAAGGPAGPGDRRRGNGLVNMRERLESIDGSCVLESQPGHGTRAVFTVPLR